MFSERYVIYTSDVNHIYLDIILPQWELQCLEALFNLIQFSFAFLFRVLDLVTDFLLGPDFNLKFFNNY